MPALPSNVFRRKKVYKELFESDYSLVPDDIICKLTKALGNYMFNARSEVTEEEIIVQIPERFRNAFYFSCGDFVVCSSMEKSVMTNKVRYEIKVVLRKDQIEQIVRDGRWPKQFEISTNTKSDDNYISEDMLPSSGDNDSSDNEEETGNEEEMNREETL